ncbi:HAMP domain-containing sensor histidine kinase [Collinsella sp. D33t1_170424_A12]|uniref:sensor histidine kinase n=1 Tax=Collinsella sp. D33t1_170424_A12 TaxID=2787135 RepID=UPI001E4EF11C|nr:HAMP domain-containing sensor histidine kinase [Collinsella sp. D33t1_170424_A12]
MSPGALAVLMLAIGVLAGALITTAAYAPELRRIARLLDARLNGGASANARVTIGSRAPGIAELAEAINGELDRTMQAHVASMRAQRDFQRDLSALSHDIRTPLTGAKGYLQLAVDEPDPELERRRIDAAVERIDRTSELLDALFSYTKASDPDLALDTEPVDLREVVEQCLLGHYPDFERLGWEPVVSGADAPRVVEANRQALERIVENLVSNALRHGSSAPRITLSDESERPVLRIENRVERPEAIDVEHLFDRFYRADAARQAGGSGLGLATAAKLAAAMDMSLGARLDRGRLTIELR